MMTIITCFILLPELPLHWNSEELQLTTSIYISSGTMNAGPRGCLGRGLEKETTPGP